MKELYTQDEVIRLLKREQTRLKLSFSEFAKSLGVSKQYLYGVFTKRQYPGRKLGFEKFKNSVRFVKVNGAKR